jgi:hypothetical protein
MTVSLASASAMGVVDIVIVVVVVEMRGVNTASCDATAAAGGTVVPIAGSVPAADSADNAEPVGLRCTSTRGVVPTFAPSRGRTLCGEDSSGDTLVAAAVDRGVVEVEVEVEADAIGSSCDSPAPFAGGGRILLPCVSTPNRCCCSAVYSKYVAVPRCTVLAGFSSSPRVHAGPWMRRCACRRVIGCGVEGALQRK